MSDAQRQCVGRGQGGLDLHRAGVDDFEHLGVDRHPLAVLRQPGRDLAADRRAQLGVGQGLARDVERGLGGLQVGACRVEAGGRVLCRRRRDEALLHQRLVVVLLALRDRELGLAGQHLLFGLLHMCQRFGGIHACQQLAGAHVVALARRQAAQLAGDARLDRGRSHRLERAGERQAALQLYRLGPEQVALGQRELGDSLCTGCYQAGGLLLLLTLA